MTEVADSTNAFRILTEAKLVDQPAFDKSLERLGLREDGRDFHLVADTKQHYNKDSEAAYWGREMDALRVRFSFLCLLL